MSAYNNAGNVDVVFDIAGYFSSLDGPSGSRFHPVDPSRLLDTRGPMSAQRRLGAEESLQFHVGGANGVPTSGATAVVLNVTAVDTTSAGYMTVWPADVARPLASNINFVPRTTVPNLVIVRVPPSGNVNVFNSSGEADVVIDVVGYFDTVADRQYGRLVPLEPFRQFDSRDIAFGDDRPMAPDSILGLGPGALLPPAYVMNVTVTGPTSAGYLTVYPGPARPPLASNLNFAPGQTVANLVIVRSGPDVDLYNSAGNTHVIVDLFAVFS